MSPIKALTMILSFFTFLLFGHSHPMPDHGLAIRSISNGVKFRILPLGASITQGQGSTDGNGYRLDLRNLLQPGNAVEYVGSVASGNMTNNLHEGHGGAIISEISNYAKNPLALGKRPNIILIHAGTNDMNRSPPVDPSNAPARLGNLTEQCLAACPDATVIIAQIIASKNSTVNALIQKFDIGVAEMVATKQQAGKHVITLDMYNLLDETTEYSDTWHPNDAGYKKIAAAWVNGIAMAGEKGWIKTPVAKRGKRGISIRNLFI